MKHFRMKKIIINEKNRIISINGRSVRSPLEHIVRSQDRYDFLLKQLQLLSISDYTIEDVIKKRTPKAIKNIEPKKTLVKKPVKKTEPTSLLDKLAEEKTE